MSNTIDIIIQAVSKGVSQTVKQTTREISTGFKKGRLAVKAFNASVGSGHKAVAGLSGQVKGLVGAYVGLEGIGKITNIIKDSDQAVFNLGMSVKAASREFSNTGSLDEWESSIASLSDELIIYSDTALRNAVSRTVDMTKRLGLSKEQMKEVIKRSADLGAGKVKLEGAIERVTAALRGEAESAEYLGLTLNENYIKAWYKAAGATQGAWKDLTDIQKAQIRYAVLLEQSNEMQGRAAASAKTFGGALALVRKEIENAVINNTDVTTSLNNLAGSLRDNAGEIGKAVSGLITILTKGVGLIVDYKEALIGIGVTYIVVSVLSKITMAVKGLNAAFLVMTGTGILAGLSSLGAAITTIITSATFAGGALAAAFIVTAGLAINEIIKLGQALWEMHKVSKLIEAIKTDQKWVDKKAADKLKEVNTQLGTNIKTLEEFNSKVKDGSIAYDKASGKWVKATAEYKKAMAEAGGYARKLSDREIEEAKRATAGLKKELDLRLSEYEKLNKEVIALQNKLQDQQMQREDDIREIRRRGMSDEAQQRDLVRQADQKMLEVRRILAENTENLTEADMKRVEALAGQAKNIYKGLDSERKAIAGVKKAWDALDEVVKRQEESKRKELDKTISKVSELQEKIETLKENITINVDAGTEQALKKITGVRQELALLKDKTITVTIRKKTVTAKASGGIVGMALGGLVQSFAGGGDVFPRRKKLIPGQGSKDDVPAMLMRGEYVLRKDSVKKYGSAFLDAINQGRIAVNMLPQFALGGLADVGKRIKRAAMQAINPAFYVSPEAVVLHPSHPSFYKGINNRMGRVKSPLGKQSGISLTNAFSAGIRKMQSGGGIDSAALRLEKERKQISNSYQTQIDYALKIGNEELAWILEEERLELEQLALELEYTLTELEMEYEEDQLELRAAYEEKIGNLRAQQNEATAKRKQIELLKKRSKTELKMSHDVYRELKGTHWGGKFYVHPMVEAKQYKEESDYYNQISDYEKTLSLIPRKKDFVEKEKKEGTLYESRKNRLDKKYAFETTSEIKQNEFDIKKIKVEAGHDYTMQTLDIEKEIKTLEAELAKALYELEKKYTTTNISGTTHWLARGGHLGYPAGFTKNRDSIPAMLTPGEYVIKESIVRTLGKDFFDSLNNFQMPRFAHFAEGGLVQNITQSSQSNSSGSGFDASVTFNVDRKDYTLYGQQNIAEQLVNELKRMDLAVA